MTYKERFTLVLFALVVVAAPSATADSFTVGISLGADFLGNGFSQGNTSSTPISVGQSFNGPVLGPTVGGGASVGASASAGPGRLGLAADSTMTVPNFTFASGSIAGASSIAAFSMDFVLGGPPGTSGTFIPVTLNTVLTGSFGTNTTNGPGVGGLVNGSATAGLISNSGQSGAFSLGQLYVDSGGGFSESGVFGGPFVSPVFSERVGDPFTVTMGFQLGTLAFVTPGTYGGGGPGSADAFGDFSHALGFPTSGFVFNLPDGFTVDSLDGAVVHNQFVPVGTIVTPEPNALFLMGSGLFALGGRIALRRKRELY
jgi:hypothetical protein